MANWPTLLDIAKKILGDAEVGLIDETTRAHPEIMLAPARTIPGISYETYVRVALGNPTTGSFRNAGEGSASVKHRYENRKTECFILEARFESDKAVADASPDGAAAYVAEQDAGTLEGEMQGLSRVFYYGRDATFGNAKGFPGLLTSLDTVNMVVDAGGTTDNIASSVWAVKFGPQAVRWVWGLNGQLNFTPVRIESLIDPADSTKKLAGYVHELFARPGLQVGSNQCLGRIKKLTTDAGKGLTDALINQLLAKFKVGMAPDVLLMTRRSHQQLQSSRTATNPTGSPAPFPTTITGRDGRDIPIAVTEALLDTETLAL